MTEPAELTHGVLVKVADFLRRLPAEQLEELARGDAKLELVGRKAPAQRAKPRLPRPADEIRATLEGIGDRVAARRYLETDLKLTVAGLQALGAALGFTVRSRKPQALDDVVEWTVGRSYDSDAIARHANAGPERH